MMRQPDKKDFKDVMKQQKQGVDAKRKQLMLIWLFNQKRHTDGSLSKHKARLCWHGGQQQWGVDFYKTYTPMVGWASVRAMLIMSKLYNLLAICPTYLLHQT
eukprot:13189737-Ditylum_brightwellii.AAC.1